jgi:hypothetical protein
MPAKAGSKSIEPLIGLCAFAQMFAESRALCGVSRDDATAWGRGHRRCATARGFAVNAPILPSPPPPIGRSAT